MNICVYCSSSDAVEEKYWKSAKELGFEFINNNISLIYGGGNVGLMGILARTIKENDGRVIGVIPQKLADYGLNFQLADETIIVKTMHERKQIMELKSDGFIILPGGFGTLEESLEIITLKQLDYHRKPIVFLNIGGFYNKLFEFFNQLYAQDFAKIKFESLYYITQEPTEAISYIKNYIPQELPKKWFEKKKFV